MQTHTDALHEIDDLLEEIGSKNHVVVVKFAAQETKDGKIIRRYEGEETAQTVATAPALFRQDKFRMLAGKKPIYVQEAYKRLGGELVSVTKNLRTNAGINFVAANLAGTDGGQVAVADWIALSNNTVAVAATDTSSTVPWSSAQATDAAASGTTGEYTALGVARKAATMAHTSNATSYTASATWTATGTVTALQKAGLFGGAGKTAQGAGATNILYLENTFTATSLVNNDQLSLTWTVNI